MLINQVKNDILNIFDIEPDWIGDSLKNPLKLIIRGSKSHELLLILRSLFGVVDGNPIIKRINKYHYTQEKTQKTLEKIVKVDKVLNSSKSYDLELLLDVISVLSQIEFLKVYPNRFSDTFIKSIVKNNIFTEINHRSYKAKLIFLLTKMGFANIHIDRQLKKFEKTQNIDGGWGELRGESSNVFTSLLVFQSLRENRLWRNKEMTQRVENYVIKNHLSESQTKAEQEMWNRIHCGYKVNNMFEGGSLMLLESMLISASENNKEKIKSLIKWFKTLQLENGCFPYHAGLAKQENTISTIRILACIKKYYLQNKD